jgi:KaiC/GvpD/RAD55 family RecA-like ATPase
MITIIYGAKGTGKTKKIIDIANENVHTQKGDFVFLSSTSRYRMEISSKIRFVDVMDIGITTKDGLLGFIKGLVNGNYDIETIYIDGVYKMMRTQIGSEEMAEFMMALDTLSNHGIKFILTISCNKEELPEFLAKYIKD